MSDEFDRRFDRMEAKVDKLVDAVTELVSIQATITNMNLRMNSHAENIKHNDERLDKIEQKLPIYDILVTASSWAGRVVLTLIVGGIVGSFFVFGG